MNKNEGRNMKKAIKELEDRKKYLDRLFKGFIIITLVGFMFVVPSYFELHIMFNLFFIALVGFGLLGMFVTATQLDEISYAIILIEGNKNDSRQTSITNGNH